MRPRSAPLIVVAALLAPTWALAHGAEVFFAVLFAPSLIVPVLAILIVPFWNASLARRAITILAVSLASAGTLGAKLAIMEWSALPSDSRFAFLLVVLVLPIVVPALAWLACSRSVLGGTGWPPPSPRD